MLGRVGVLAGLLAALVVAGPAHASLLLDQSFTADGQPSLSATDTGGGSAAVSWSTCTAADTCTPTGASGATYAPGETAKGMLFKATSGGQSATSPAWGGRITATAAPTLTGTTAVGSAVTPHAGTWTGGWPDDSEALYVQRCDTADGQNCINTELYCGGPPHGRPTRWPTPTPASTCRR